MEERKDEIIQDIKELNPERLRELRSLVIENENQTKIRLLDLAYRPVIEITSMIIHVSISNEKIRKFVFTNEDILLYLLRNLYKNGKSDKSTELIKSIFDSFFPKGNIELLFKTKDYNNLLNLLEKYIEKKIDGDIPNDEKQSLQQIYFFCYAIVKNYFYKRKLNFEEFDSLFSSLEIIANLSSFLFGIGDYTPLFDIIFDMLNIIETETETKEKCNKTIYKQTRLYITEDEDEDSNEMYYGYQCCLIRILANICHQNKKIQDKIREKGLIPLILKKSNIDFENPYIQEWCIICIRNMVEDNEENSKEIAKFKPMEVDPATQSVMKKMGMGIKIDEGNKVSVTKL